MPGPVLTLAQLTTPLTRQEVQASIYAVLARVGVNTSSWKSGAVVRTMIVGVASVSAAFSALIARVARLGFLSLSEGEWLDLVAWHVYGVERDQATFATGEVIFTNAGGGVFDLDAGDVVIENASTKAAFRTTAAVHIGAGPFTSAPVPVIAVEAGAASSSEPGALHLVTTLPGVTATNAAAIVGVDRELDPQLIAKSQEMLGSLSPMGPWDAYTFAARQAKRASDSSPIGVTRVRLDKDGYGHVDVYVAKVGGTIEGDADDPSTDLGAIAQAIYKNAEPQGITARVHAATPHTVSVTCEVWLYNTSGRTEVQIKTAIQAAVASLCNALPVGGIVIDPRVIGGPPPTGRIYLDALRSAIASALPGVIVHVEISSPASDIELTLDEVPIGGTVTTTLHPIPPTEGYNA